MTDTDTERPGVDLAALVAQLERAGLTVAVAESLTGGLVLAALTAVPGVSAVLRGGAVVYATDTKASQLGVDTGLLRERGPVDPDVALAMARGVRERWGSDVGLATTGVAGPQAPDGHTVGEVYIAVADGSGGRAERVAIPHVGTSDVGSREQIRAATVHAVVRLLHDWVS